MRPSRHLVLHRTFPFWLGAAGVPCLGLGWWALRPFSEGPLDLGGPSGAAVLLALAVSAAVFCRVLAAHSGLAAIAGLIACVSGLGWVAWRAEPLGGGVVADGLPGLVDATDLPEGVRRPCGEALARIARATWGEGLPDREDARWRERLLDTWRNGPPAGGELLLLCNHARLVAVRLPPSTPAGEESAP